MPLKGHTTLIVTAEVQTADLQRNCFQWQAGQVQENPLTPCWQSP